MWNIHLPLQEMWNWYWNLYRNHILLRYIHLWIYYPWVGLWTSSTVLFFLCPKSQTKPSVHPSAPDAGRSRRIYMPQLEPTQDISGRTDELIWTGILRCGDLFLLGLARNIFFKFEFLGLKNKWTKHIFPITKHLLKKKWGLKPIFVVFWGDLFFLLGVFFHQQIFPRPSTLRTLRPWPCWNPVGM